jgi:2-polyprenyl-3-methyl-5-hydroxy-6-metoxy-1,4-benzoquinol methylase
MMDLHAEFGALDIYLFDQLLRGRITRRDRIVDAGCGMGRNVAWMLRNGYDVWGLDPDPDAIREVRALPSATAERFRQERLQEATFPDAFATVVISSAVLHFARDDDDFHGMLHGTWRMLAPGGMFFCRLASSIGIEARITPLDGSAHRYRLPDGTLRYLVDEPRLMALTRQLGGQLLDLLKTTVVQDQRSMTTWVVRKN